MTAVLDTTPEHSEAASTPDPVPASWAARAGALLVDTLPGAGVVATAALLALATPADDAMRWVFTAVAGLALFAMAVNRLVLPHAVGWTLGRALFGLRVAHRSGRPVGVVRLAVRELAHLLDTLALGVGWLWPLWDRRRRTFADLLLRTEVHRVVAPNRDMRRLVAAVLIGAAVVCAAGAGAAYAVVYRQERAVDEARAQIAEQGPRIVEQMLSYSVDTMDEDFDRAQQLTTDGYRPQLTAQQQALRSGQATSNEYWAVASAVLTNPPVAPDRAAMLLAMQGQRGTNPEDLRFITATVRVEFERSGQGQWQVAGLTVLKKPMMSEAGQ